MRLTPDRFKRVSSEDIWLSGLSWEEREAKDLQYRQLLLQELPVERMAVFMETSALMLAGGPTCAS
jgi:hypothetical protein